MRMCGIFFRQFDRIDCKVNAFKEKKSCLFWHHGKLVYEILNLHNLKKIHYTLNQKILS